MTGGKKIAERDAAPSIFPTNLLPAELEGQSWNPKALAHPMHIHDDQ